MERRKGRKVMRRDLGASKHDASRFEREKQRECERRGFKKNSPRVFRRNGHEERDVG